jgi:serine/threonine protein kinase
VTSGNPTASLLFVFTGHAHVCCLQTAGAPNPPHPVAEIGAGLELPPQTMSELQRESGVMARMRHPNIVSFMGLCALPPCILTGDSTCPGAVVAFPVVAFLACGAALALLCPAATSLLLLLPLCAPSCLVTEYCSRGSLFELLQNPSAAPQLTWAVRLSMALDAARGLLYLHSSSPPIIHRDIKSPNLLVDAGWRLKVGWQQLWVCLGPIWG